jgi:ABC-type nickel/cobalt efflux system permease component RcnA
MHHQMIVLLFAGAVLLVGIALFVFWDRCRAGRPRKADDRYLCKLSANREYEAQQRRHHLA